MQLNKKNWIWIPVVGMILLVGYVVFFFSQSKPVEEVPNGASQMIEVKGERDPESSKSKKTQSENSSSESQEEAAYPSPQTIGGEQKIAEDFVTAYFEFNGDQPNENIEKALKFVTTDLASGIRGQSQVVRPVEDLYKLKVTQLRTSEGDPWSSRDLWYIIVVNGQFYSEQGEPTETIETTYQVFIKQNEKGIWQVSDFALVRN